MDKTLSNDRNAPWYTIMLVVRPSWGQVPSTQSGWGGHVLITWRGWGGFSGGVHTCSLPQHTFHGGIGVIASEKQNKENFSDTITWTVVCVNNKTCMESQQRKHVNSDYDNAWWRQLNHNRGIECPQIVNI